MEQFNSGQTIIPHEPADKKEMFGKHLHNRIKIKTESGLADVWWGAEVPAKPKGLSKKRKLKGGNKNTNRMLKTSIQSQADA